MVPAIVDLSLALPIAGGLLIVAGVLAVIAVAIHRRHNPPPEAIRRRGVPTADLEDGSEVR